MIATIAERDWLAPLILSGGALVFGALVARSPKVAFALLAAGAVLMLSLRAPLTTLVLLLVLTAIVPYELQHRFAIGASSGSPGLLLATLFWSRAYSARSWS